MIELVAASETNIHNYCSILMTLDDAQLRNNNKVVLTFIQRMLGILKWGVVAGNFT